MYEAFFGLREKPFNLTPDPRFLFLSEKHKEAFAHLLYGIKNRGGFVMVTGEIVTGKTTICRTLLGKLEDDTEVVYQMGDFHAPELASGVRWDDPAFGIPWPLAAMHLSERDLSYPDFDAAAFSREYQARLEAGEQP